MAKIDVNKVAKWTIAILAGGAAVVSSISEQKKAEELETMKKQLAELTKEK